MSVILKNVSMSFEGKKVLSNITMTIAKGARICFFGNSGCGKTTLLRIICGLEEATEGCVEKTEKTVFACDFQEDRLLPWYSVMDNLKMVCKDEKRITEYLEYAGLSDTANMYPDQLSGGMRRRISLIRALVFPSDILVLDEPFRELDKDAVCRMMKLTEKTLGDRTLLLVTHDIEQAKYLGADIATL